MPQKILHEGINKYSLLTNNKKCTVGIPLPSIPTILQDAYEYSMH